MTANDMYQTMNEIDDLDNTAPPKNVRNGLRSDISNLEHAIVYAEKALKKINDNAPSDATISPEQANKAHRDIVFLKKDLGNKQTEYDQLVDQL